MPIISQFYGIKIAMFYNDHNPPHFHVIYGEYTAVFLIEPLKIKEGKLPKRALKMIEEWAKNNKKELLNDWNLAVNHKVLNYINPLV